MARRWFEEEINILIENYTNCTDEEMIQLIPEKTISAIKNKAKMLNLKRTDEIKRKNRSEGISKKREGLWSEREKSILKENYPKYGAEYTHKLLPNRSIDTIRTNAKTLGVKYIDKNKWTSEMEKYLKEIFWEHDNVGDMLDEINNRFSTNKTYSSLCRKLHKMNLNVTGVTKITEEEVEKVGEYFESELTFEEIANALKMNASRVRVIFRKCGILKVEKWSEEEVDILIKMYPLSEMKDIRKNINRSVKMIHKKARDLGLERYIEIEQCSSDIYSKDLTATWSRAKTEEKKLHGLEWEDYEIMSFDEVLNVYTFFDEKCPYCNRNFRGVTFDHFIPMTKGGRLTKDNTLIVCHHCNTSKLNKDFEEWYEEKEYNHYVDKTKQIHMIEKYFETINHTS